MWKAGLGIDIELTLGIDRKQNLLFTFLGKHILKKWFVIFTDVFKFEH